MSKQKGDVELLIDALIASVRAEKDARTVETRSEAAIRSMERKTELLELIAKIQDG